MFTGLVQELGRIENISRNAGNAQLAIAAPELIGELKSGDSVAINGVCLTAESISTSRGTFTATAVMETLSRTTLGSVRRGDNVNLELSLRPSDRLGGHFLQGHVDAVGRCFNIRQLRGSWLLKFTYPSEFARYIVEKGSIAVDGISLTAYDITRDTFTVSIVPHTFNNTTLGDTKVGREVNLEFDLIGKYIAKQQGLDTGTITIEKLQEYGY